jgi:hypothetical protein
VVFGRSTPLKVPEKRAIGPIDKAKACFVWNRPIQHVLISNIAKHKETFAPVSNFGNLSFASFSIPLIESPKIIAYEQSSIGHQLILVWRFIWKLRFIFNDESIQICREYFGGGAPFVDRLQLKFQFPGWAVDSYRDPRPFNIDESLSAGLSSLRSTSSYSDLPVDETESGQADRNANNSRVKISTIEAIGRTSLILCSFLCACWFFYKAPIADSIWRFYGLIACGVLSLWICFSVLYTWLFGFREWFRM